MARRCFTAEECERVRRLWVAGETELFIAKSVSATIDVFRQARKDGQFTDLKPRGGLVNGNRGYRSPDITQDEIEERCREVQATWSEDERAARAGISGALNLQFVRMSDLPEHSDDHDG
jgi:hypothetical protein